MNVLCESDLPLQKREELIIPFTCIASADGELQLTAYPDAIPYLVDIPDRTAQDFFQREHLLAIEAVLVPYLDRYGYEREAEDAGRYHLTLQAPAILPIAPTDRPTRLTAQDFDRLENLTDFTPDYLDQIAYATVADGKIVSLAAENPNSTDELCEIYVETHPDYQGKGLATENTAALTKEMLACGRQVIYRCAADHTASLAIARKLGFFEIERFYCHNAYRKEEF